MYSIDHYGHGRSVAVSERGYIADYNILVNDFIAFSEYARKLHNDKEELPFFIIAHSVGTLIATLSLEKIPNVTAVVYSGCGLTPGPAAASPFGVRALYPLFQGKFGLNLACMLSNIAPKAPAAPIDINGLTSDKNQIDILKLDPHRYASEVMNKTGYEVLKMSEAARNAVNKNIIMPIYIMHGDLDEICLPTGSEFIRNYAGTPLQYIDFYLIKNNLHEIFQEQKVKSVTYKGVTTEYNDGVIEAIVCATNYLDYQYNNRNSISEDMKLIPKRAIPTLASILPPVKFKSNSPKSPQTREITKHGISLNTSNNVIS